MIISLSLENWKSHSRSSFGFARGTNVLVGRMGAGKSSVLDALCFALYGTFPKMGRRDQSTETVVNIASGAEFATVKLEFDRSGKKYSVFRKIGKSVSEAEISCEGKLAQKGPKQVTEYITQILEVDYELFTRAIYSEQNRMDQLLSLTPRARKQEIDWLLGLGKFDEAGRNFFEGLCLNPSLKINSDNPALWSNICKLLEGNGDFKIALTLCDKAIVRFPTNEEFIKQRATLQKFLDSAETERKKQIESKISECRASAKKTENCEISPINPGNTIENPKNESVIEKSKEISEHEPVQIRNPNNKEKTENAAQPHSTVSSHYSIDNSYEDTLVAP
ncbi:MAG: SMC family ATPase, partial [Candidatus Micrarchaeota archaeon]|nr:SMC family ATPase [Candidatus Micrarchaeota archaeon]